MPFPLRHPCASLLLAATIASPARTQPPSTDVWLVPLVTRDGSLTLGAPRNATARAGYDNQPSWTPRGDAILFTSNRDGAQTDIFRFDVAARRITQVTDTPESEYSATMMAGGDAISVVRVERDSAQRLWRFPLAGGTPSVILANVRPVGYHAWGNEHTLGLFVLGAPATFQIADTRNGRTAIVSSRIGRGIAKAPGVTGISFVEKWSAEEWWVFTYDFSARTLARVAPTLPGVEDYAWTPSGVLLMARESRIFAWNPRSRSWDLAGDLSREGVQGITRLSVSPRGDLLAFVARDRAP